MLTLSNQAHDLHLKLEVLGYEFPKQPYDNWCLLGIALRYKDYEFKKVDPAIETTDILEIYNWFDALSKFSLPHWAKLSFIEPCIGFEFLAYCQNKVRIGVTLSHELKPDFPITDDYELIQQNKACMIIFELEAYDFSPILISLEETMMKFPVRKI